MRAKVILSLIIFCFLLKSFAQQAFSPAIRDIELRNSEYAGIKIKVFDAQTRYPLPARIVVTDQAGQAINSYYKKLPGVFTDENGTYNQPLGPGDYDLSVYHGIDYISRSISFKITDSGVDASIYLSAWHNLKNNGWYCGDGHDHLYTDVREDTAKLDSVRKICLAQGIDFMFTAQGWAGYNDSTWKAGYAKYSDNKFHIYYGAEMPKYRTGHTWWMGLNSTRNYFWQTMDTTYENFYYQSGNIREWNFTTLPFPQIPDVEVVQRLKKDDHSLAIIAHPTSWWWQERDSINRYITNVAVNLSYGLLSGKIWDGLVVMGYDHDHYYYQNLWFNILNLGYRMPAFSELDGGFGKEDKFYYGSMRTYFKVNGEFSREKLLESARKGRTMVTSGPILYTNIDNKYEVGDVIQADGKLRHLNIQAAASGDSSDFLTYVVVFRNGDIYRVFDLRDSKPRTFNTRIDLREANKAWYIVKAYGENSWNDTAMLDVMKVCANRKNVKEVKATENDVAFTSPYYFRKGADIDPPALHPVVKLKVVPPAGKAALQDISIEILTAGKLLQKIPASAGTAKFKMPLKAVLKISAKEYQPIYRSLYLDYAPHLEIIENLSSGKWLHQYDSTETFNPGEVPFNEFQYHKTKKIFENVEWTIELSPNERDPLWKEFEEKFLADKTR